MNERERRIALNRATDAAVEAARPSTDPARLRQVARHSCYDQMTWLDGGVRRVGRVTAENVRAALAAGDRFVVYTARNGVPHSIGRALGECYLANLEAGYYAHG